MSGSVLSTAHVIPVSMCIAAGNTMDRLTLNTARVYTLTHIVGPTARTSRRREAAWSTTGSEELMAEPSLVDTYGVYIDGKWVEPDSGGRYDVVDPATEEVIASAPDPSVAQVEQAIGAARAAF